MARTKHTGLRSRAGPKSRMKRIQIEPQPAAGTQASSDVRNTTPVESEQQSGSHHKKLKSTPASSLSLQATTTTTSSSTSPRFLPPELHRIILIHILHLHHHPTLLSCSLVSHSWFHICKPHLFHTIFLKSPTQLNLLVNTLDDPRRDPRCGGVHLAKRIEVEQGAGAGDVAWGHNVLIRLAGRMGSDVREMIFENREKFDSGGEDLRVAFAATTTQTPNTTTSGGADNGNKKTPPTKKPIETFCAHPSLTLLLPALFARFENLTTLRLDLYQFRSLADLLRLVGSLPKLHTLGCHRLSWKHMPPALTGGGGYAYGSRRGTMWAPLRSLTVTRCPSVWPMLHFFDAGSSNSRRGRTLLPVQSTSGSSSTSKDTLAVSKIPPFPGLDSAEAQVIVEIGTLYGLGSSSVNPDLEVKCKWSGSTKRWILRICDIYHIHELQFHLSVSDSKVPHTTVSANNINPSPARIREIIFVSHSGLHRTGDIVPEEVGVLLSRLVYLDRIVFDAAWDSEAEEEALEGLGGELREKTEVVLGASSKAWQTACRSVG